jgi:hypothetical protein
MADTGYPVTVATGGLTVGVSITPAGGVFIDAAMTTPAIFPAIISNTTTWFTRSGSYTVSTTYDGLELADSAGTASVSTGPGAAAPIISPIANLNATKAAQGGQTTLLTHLELVQLWAFGHSWQAINTNATPNSRYFERFASRYRMGAITNMGLSGRTIGDVAMANLGGSFAWTVGSKALILSACYINDLTLLGDTAPAQRGFQHALRSCLSRWTSLATIAASTTTFEYLGSGWASQAVPIITSTPPAGAAAGSTSGTQWKTTQVGDNFSVLVPGDSADLVFIARAAGAGLYTAKVSGVTVATLDLTAATAQDCPAVMKLRSLGAGNHTVTVTLTSGASMTVDSMNIPNPTPTVGAIIAEGDCVGGTLPGGSISATYVAAQALFRTLQQAVVAEYPSFTWVDLQANGWNSATMLTSDGKHPQDHGCAFIADRLGSQMVGAGQTFNQSLNVLNSANDPTVPSFGAVTIPFLGVDGTGGDPNAPTNLTTARLPQPVSR